MAINDEKGYEVASQNSGSEKERDNVENGTAPVFVNQDVANLTQEHRDYLMQRHGTLDLDPLPSADPADPYNWPQWKKVTNLACVAFHVSN